MNVTPSDIRNYEFAHQMRGYDREEVDNFLEQVATAFEALKQENLKLSAEVDSLKTQLAGLRQFEDTIKNAAIDARRNADMTVANAKKEAELILSKAKAEAEKIVGSRADKVNEIEEQIAKLQLAKKSYLTQLRTLIKSHLDLLDEITKTETPAEGKGSLEVTESTDITRKKIETVATKPSQPEAIKTEEANAPDRIVPVASEEPEPTPDSTATKEDTTGASSQQSELALDPELAAALEIYQRKQAQEAAAQTTPPKTDSTPPPAPGQIVETSARAEDIPEGFIPKDDSDPDSATTDKIPTDDEKATASAEPHPVKTDETTETTEGDSPLAPENLAEELDKVVAKFEEEMDKASKN
jgi:cell division initiation protein